MDLIADTNVWYDIGAGRRDPGALKSDGNRLVATPTSFLEIASRIDQRALNERKKAAAAVVSHADDIAEDPESHLRKLWGRGAGAQFPWIEGFKVIAQATSVSQLGNGVRDFHQNVSRKLNVQLAQAWREYHWSDFSDQVANAIDQHCPGYKAARESGRYIYLRKENAKTFADAMQSNEVRSYIVASTFIRAQLGAETLRTPTQAEHNHAEPLLAPYVGAYIEYVIGCATGSFAPQPNDFGDSECFLYLQNNNALLSSDHKWVKIARKVCPSHYLDPEMKVAN